MRLSNKKGGMQETHTANENCGIRANKLCRYDFNTLLVTGKPAELHHPCRFGKEGIVFALADEFTRMDHGTALTDYNTSRADQLAAETLDTKHLRIAVAAVYAAAAAFFMRHSLPYSLPEPLMEIISRVVYC